MQRSGFGGGGGGVVLVAEYSEYGLRSFRFRVCRCSHPYVGNLTEPRFCTVPGPPRSDFTLDQRPARGRAVVGFQGGRKSRRGDKVSPSSAARGDSDAWYEVSEICIPPAVYT